MAKSGIYRNCDKCGKEYYVFPYQVGKSKFCSIKCARSTGTTVICEWCGKEFYVPNYRLKTVKYCSTSCEMKFRTKDGAWNKGIPNPTAVEHLRSTWETNKGNTFAKGLIPWNKGTKGLVKPNSGTLKKGHLLNKGVKLSPERREQIGKINKGRKFGPMSPEQRRKISEAQKGEKSAQWKGGLTDINKTIRMSVDFKLWREAVFSRDNWTCQQCGVRGGRLHPHHVKSFAEHPELRFDISNGQTLCVECHKKTDNYAKNIKTA